MFRNMTLEQRGLSAREYMRCKHHLADKIMHRIFDEEESADESS
jgi:predicted metal-binding transcription factor (methanogenesis marker protein 9)